MLSYTSGSKYKCSDCNSHDVVIA
ncbi:hypothetical protein AB0X78_19295 [Bacillus velezensis]